MPKPIINQTITLDFESMTIADLMKEAQRLALVLTLCNDQRHEIFKIINTRKAIANGEERVARMTQTQKDALLTVLNKP